MPVNEIDKASLVAKNESLPAEERITAVRDWLRLTNYSARSCIIARRIAKKILRDYKVNLATFEMSQKAERLLNFVEKGVKEKSKPTPQEQAVAASPSAEVAPAELSGKQTYPGLLAEYNRGWDASPIPKKFIAYKEPADLPAFGIPADPDLAYNPSREFEGLEITTDLGGV